MKIKSCFIAALALLAIFSNPVSAATAVANSTVFPPVNQRGQECGSDQLRVLSWAMGAPTTVCLDGQEVLKLAIPTCSANQVISYDGTKFSCKTQSSIPTCGEDEYLSYNGSDYECKSTKGPPQCGSNQVLTATGSGFTCVDRSEGVPNCASDQFLTYNGSAYQCANTKKPSLQCRVVSATGPAPFYVSSIHCNDDEVATGGGGMAESPGSDLCSGLNKGFLHYSAPDGNGWAVDAYRYDYEADICTRAYAVCCKIKSE